MNTLQLVRRGLVHHWRLNLAVACGVMAGTAVLTGALLVGDSVRGSLRDLTLQRLGQIDEALVAPHFFRQHLADELAGQPGFDEHFQRALPAVLLQASFKNPSPDPQQADRIRGFAAGVTVLGTSPDFWKLGDGGPKQPPGDDQVVLNGTLADELGVSVGDEVLLRLQQVSQVHSETLLAKDEEVESRQLKVVDIIPTRGLGRFGLHPNQQLPKNAYTNLATLQSVLDKPGQVNAILVAGKTAEGDDPDPTAAGALNKLLKPQLADYGLRLEQTPRGYFNLTTERLLLAEPVEQAALKAFADRGAQPALTYLANEIAAGEPGQAQIPYSTVTAVDFDASPALGAWKRRSGEPLPPLKADGIVLNAEAFDDLNRQLQKHGEELTLGDEIRVTYFEPEEVDGKAVERTAEFVLRGVVPLDEDSPANDRHFTPDVPGVTDQDTIANWSPPFPYDSSRVRSGADDNTDEDYWDQYKATPKAFVAMATGRRLWASKRFGRLTSIRIPAEADIPADQQREQLVAAMNLQPDELGLRFEPVKANGLEAARGTTDFGVLFISFSFFIIAAAMMLVLLLFRLGIENRAAEIGTLLAAGFSRRKVRRVLAAEGLGVAALGGLAGIALGAGYAWLMLYGLRTWWVEAVTTPFLYLHATWLSFLIGYASGVLLSLAAAWWALRQMRKLPVRQLLAGQATEDRNPRAGRPWISITVGVVGVIGAALLAVMATTGGGESQAGTFFGSGALALVGGLALLCVWLRGRAGGRLITRGALPGLRLAARNGARNPGRSTLTIAMVASATFLVVALSTFQLDPSQQAPKLDSGNGGFSLVAETTAPVPENLNRTEDLEQLGLQDDEIETLRGSKVIGFRILPGEDASCQNLYQTVRPRVLGVPPALVDRGGFAWAGTLAETPKEEANPWLLLSKDAGKDDEGRPYIPVIMDMNTAMYSLHLFTPGSTMSLEDDGGRQVQLKLVGMLAGSIFQGDILMSQQQLLANFPQVDAPRFFLVETPETGAADTETTTVVRGVLESALSDRGLDAQRTGDRLAGFLAVQNTYLLTFQSLGALGLLLGTFGLATVQLRNVLERRGELALLRAAGFTRSKLARLVMTENALLLVGGLALGAAAALLAVAPHLAEGAARIPLTELSIALAVILAVGLAAGLIAVWAMLKAPLIRALRGD